jgi:hypothetical protein
VKRWIWVIVLAVALAGCGGIPTSGSVQPGAVIDEEPSGDFVYNPAGPQKGDSQLVIMRGFILAATNPQNDYEVARSFLDESIRGDWKPDEIVRIRSDVGLPREESETEYSYTLTSSAYVDSSGQYQEREPSTQVLEFGFIKDADGEWRISSAPEGIVLSDEAFGAIFNAYPLYFFDPSNAYLVPDLRWFAKTSRLPNQLVRGLLGGQSAWLQQGVTNSYFPEGTTLASSVVIDSGVATVDLSDDARDASPEQRDRMRQQLRDTLGTVSDVIITVNGVPINVPNPGANPAIIDPQVESRILVSQGTDFGFLGSSGSLGSLEGESAQVVALGAIDATLARGQRSTAVLAPGGVYLVATGADKPLLLDDRPGLLSPAVDNAGFVWTVAASDATALTAFDRKGKAYAIAVPEFAGSAVSFTISRDGSRVLMLVETNLGPRLFVAGIVRREGVPTQLGASVALPIGPGTALDAAWVDDNSVATLTRLGSAAANVTRFEIGGPSEALGRVDGGVAIVGGNDETDGIRVLTADGSVYLKRGNGWADTNTKVTFIATQQ